MSVHILITGISLSGKTNLAKRLAADESAAGKNIVVYDPIASQGWPGNAVKYSEPSRFLDRINHLSNALVFVDEAKTLWDFNEDAADALVYKGRHRGFLCVLMAQRSRMVPPNARNQCARVFSFKQQPYDAQILADEYHGSLVNTPDLKPGEFIYTDGFAVYSGKLDYSAGLPPTPQYTPANTA